MYIYIYYYIYDTIAILIMYDYILYSTIGSKVYPLIWLIYKQEVVSYPLVQLDGTSVFRSELGINDRFPTGNSGQLTEAQAAYDVHETQL